MSEDQIYYKCTVKDLKKFFKDFPHRFYGQHPKDLSMEQIKMTLSIVGIESKKLHDHMVDNKFSKWEDEDEIILMEHILDFIPINERRIMKCDNLTLTKPKF